MQDTIACVTVVVTVIHSMVIINVVIKLVVIRMFINARIESNIIIIYTNILYY